MQDTNIREHPDQTYHTSPLPFQPSQTTRSELQAIAKWLGSYNHYIPNQNSKTIHNKKDRINNISRQNTQHKTTERNIRPT